MPATTQKLIQYSLVQPAERTLDEPERVKVGGASPRDMPIEKAM